MWAIRIAPESDSTDLGKFLQIIINYCARLNQKQGLNALEEGILPY
jgi:hypothetical protein